MDIMEVKNHIKSKNPKNFYIFSGTEIQVQNIYINKLAECKGLETARVDSVTDIYGKLKNRSFVQKSYCYIIRDDKEFTSNEKLWDTIQTVIGSNMLIFLLTNVDKRLKFYKRWKDIIVDFEPLPEATLKKYIKKEIALGDDNCNKLIDLCESDYSRILLEIDKIKTYYDYAYEVELLYSCNTPDKIFEYLLDQGVIYKPPKDAIFDYVDAVLKHEVSTAFNLLEQCYAVGESTIVLLSVLYTNIKQVLQVQSCKSSDIAKSTGLTGWQIKCAKEKMGHYSIGDLVYMLKLVRDTEMKIKTGEIEEQIAVPYIMVNIF